MIIKNKTKEEIENGNNGKSNVRRYLSRGSLHK